MPSLNAVLYMVMRYMTVTSGDVVKMCDAEEKVWNARKMKESCVVVECFRELPAAGLAWVQSRQKARTWKMAIAASGSRRGYQSAS
jgi:hypothetical protein